uniref:Uncharacterized protein n=1 Tax=Solanum lycopersicum TaxID=4081 RepID=A0A3Q7EDM7_SOLLC
MASYPVGNIQRVVQRQASNVIIACGLHTSTHDRTTSGMAYHHRPWIAYMAWNSIISLGQHTRSNDVGRGMPSSHLANIHGQKNSSDSNDVRRGMPSSYLDSKHDRMMTGVACLYGPWETH